MPEDKDINRWLVMGDGTVLENCECGYSNKNLWCFLTGIPFGEAFQYFSTPEKISKVLLIMKFGSVIVYTRYSGFEEVTEVRQNDEHVDVRLQGYRITVEKERVIAEDDPFEANPFKEAGE